MCKAKEVFELVSVVLHEDIETIGIFSTVEKALEYYKTICKKSTKYDYYELYKYEIDNVESKEMIRYIDNV